MLKTMIKGTLSVVVCAFSAFASTSNVDVQRAASVILLNGEETSVHFNDGDTFKIIDGDLRQSRVRIVGINALETFGPVHSWLDSSQDYLLTIANLATSMAREGLWHCTTKGKKDTYGRLLAKCDDLAIALISAGAAHAYSMDSKPASRKYLKQQLAAQAAGKGMWKYGIPEYIITSLHSADEGSDRPYNRLISTDDGSSELSYHHDSYDTCEAICLEDDSSCMVYVPYENRYGRNRPECLR